MVKHIVFFKLKDNSTQSKEEVKQKLLTLKEKIEYIEDLEIGLNFAKEDRAYDLALIVVLKNRDDLKKYAIDEYHQEVISFIKLKAIDTKVVDFEY